MKKKILKRHRLPISIPSASACEGRLANSEVACWTANQWDPGNKKILAEKIAMIGHQFHYSMTNNFRVLLEKYLCELEDRLPSATFIRMTNKFSGLILAINQNYPGARVPI